MKGPLVELVSVTDVVYRSRLARWQRLCAEESVLRQKLVDLGAMRHLAASEMGMRALGADLLWQGWVMRQKTELNVQLARLLVQKEAMRKDLQLSFGKAQVAGRLLQDHEANRRKIRSWDD